MSRLMAQIRLVPELLICIYSLLKEYHRFLFQLFLRSPCICSTKHGCYATYTTETHYQVLIKLLSASTAFRAFRGLRLIFL